MDLERRLVAAGVDLLAEAGTDALTLRAIARIRPDRIALDALNAPKTVNNFVFLAAQLFFHLRRRDGLAAAAVPNAG